MDKRLAIYLTMLGSNQPGEVLAAVTMLLKHLTKNGRDLHWLASRLSSPVSDSGDMAAVARLRAELTETTRELAAANLKLTKSHARARELERELSELRRTQQRKPHDQRGRREAETTWREMARWALDYGRDKRMSGSDNRFLYEMSIRRQDIPLNSQQESRLNDIYQRLRDLEDS